MYVHIYEKVFTLKSIVTIWMFVQLPLSYFFMENMEKRFT